MGPIRHRDLEQRRLCFRVRNEGEWGQESTLGPNWTHWRLWRLSRRGPAEASRSDTAASGEKLSAAPTRSAAHAVAGHRSARSLRTCRHVAARSGLILTSRLSLMAASVKDRRSLSKVSL